VTFEGGYTLIRNSIESPGLEPCFERHDRKDPAEREASDGDYHVEKHHHIYQQQPSEV